MIHVLFVCLGNICRSPMAEAVFRHKVKAQGLEDKIKVDSAGTGHWHVGSPPHEGTRNVLDARQISYEGIKARQVNRDDFEAFDYIVAMDGSNVANLKKLGAPVDRIYRLLELVPERKESDVPDPYYTGNFDEVYAMIDEGCMRLLAYIREREGL